MKQTHEFEATESLSLENSFMTIKEHSDVKLHITIGINSDDYGWFELYDEETGGEEWYAEGGLWFDGKVVTEYDGVFCLPDSIVKKLVELGYDVSEVA
jgi:hypothetical protein